MKRAASPKLIINCDDAGMHPAANDACINLVSKGKANSTSLMAVGNAFEDAVQKFHESGITAVGVHLTLNSEYENLPTKPLTEGVSLRSSLGEFLACPFQTGQVATIEDVQEEFLAQIERVQRSGLSITHLDGHMFCYESEVAGRKDFLQLVGELASSLQVPYRNRSASKEDNSRAVFMIWDEVDDVPCRAAYYQEFLTCFDGVHRAELIIHPVLPNEEFERLVPKAEWRFSDYAFFSSWVGKVS